jgi:hypothetical protein
LSADGIESARSPFSQIRVSHEDPPFADISLDRNREASRQHTALDGLLADPGP